MSIQLKLVRMGVVPDDRILELVEEHFDLRPSSIIKGLGLQKPIYRPTAAYGHFGRKDLQLPWEWTDKAAALRGALAKMGK